MNNDETPHDDEAIVTRADEVRHLTPRRAAAFLGLVRAGDRLSRELSRTLEREHQLSLPAFEVLLYLSAFSPDRTMGMRELSARAPLSQSRVSRLVAELETRDLVARRRDTDDGRGVTVSITEKGFDLFVVAQETHLADLDAQLFSKLTATEIEQLGAITSKLLAADDIRPRNSHSAGASTQHDVSVSSN